MRREGRLGRRRRLRVVHRLLAIAVTSVARNEVAVLSARDPMLMMVMMSQIVGAGVLARFAVRFPARDGRRRLPRVPPRLGRRRCSRVRGLIPFRDRDRVDAQRARATLPSISSRSRRRRGGSRGGVVIAQALTPRPSQVAFDEPARGRIDVAVLRAGEERLEAFAQLLALVRVVAELSVGQEWMQHAQVGMLELFPPSKVNVSAQIVAENESHETDPFGIFPQVVQLPDENIDQDAEVVCVKVLLRARSGEQEVEDLEDEQRDAERVWAVVCENGEGAREER